MKTSMTALMENGFGLVLLLARIGRAWWLPVLLLLATTATVQADYWGYTTNSDNTITITGYAGPGGALTIPSIINGLPVTSIGGYAFYRCTSLTSVTIPNGVISIGDLAFESCTSLTSVTIGDGVTSIGMQAFYGCASLTSITIGNGVTSIGYAVFYDCTRLAGVYFRGNAPGISSRVFYGDNNATVYYLAGTTGWGPKFGGRPTALWNLSGPIIKANGAVGKVTINYPKTVSVTVAVNAGDYVGIPVDWWVVALAGSSWYYLDNSFQWTAFDGNLSHCNPVHQGPLFDLPATLLPKLNITGLPVGSYTFWFAVDYPMDGILNLDGPIMADSVNVTVLSAGPAPSVKANGTAGEIAVHYPENAAITMEMNASDYAGVPADWWFLLCADSSWYYLNDSVQWAPFNGNLSNCHPFYQGALFNLSSVPILAGSFPRGTYNFYFVVDCPMNGVLNVEQCWGDSVRVNVQ